MRLKKITTALCAAAALAGGVLAAAPAQAAGGFDRCPAGEFCLFTALDGGGTIASFKVGSSDLRLQGVDNNVWSAINKTGKSVCGYGDYNYTGEGLFGPWPASDASGQNMFAYTATRLSSVKVGC